MKPLPVNGRLEPIDSQKAEDILPKILPPVIFEKDGQLWNQKVSATPATRLDVQRLATVSTVLTKSYQSYIFNLR